MAKTELPDHRNQDGGKSSLRKRVLHTIERPKFHIIIISLVMADLFLVMAELVLSLYASDEKCAKNGSQELLEKLETIEEIVGHISFALLCVFVVEVIIRIWATGVKEFFKHWFNYIDVIVVFGSFIIEVLFTYIKIDVGHDASTYSKVLIILRMIRIIRMLHAVAHAVEMMEDEKIQALEEANMELVERLKEKEGDRP